MEIKADVNGKFIEATNPDATIKKGVARLEINAHSGEEAHLLRLVHDVLTEGGTVNVDDKGISATSGEITAELPATDLSRGPAPLAPEEPRHRHNFTTEAGKLVTDTDVWLRCEGCHEWTQLDRKPKEDGPTPKPAIN